MAEIRRKGQAARCRNISFKELWFRRKKQEKYLGAGNSE